MKRLLLIAVLAIFGLSACSSNQYEAEGQLESFRGDLLSAQEAKANRKKPRLPKLPTEEVKASVLDAIEQEGEPDLSRMERIFMAIDSDLQGPRISFDDIERGFYYADQSERKVGTPSSWEWIKDGNDSRWQSPNNQDEVETTTADKLCDDTAGTYLISCIEYEVEHCEYIPKSECRCPDGTAWVEEQGCILLNPLFDSETEEQLDEFVVITSEDLNKGWYYGLPNEKKLNTPTYWLWVESGKDSKWQNPSPIN